MFENIGFGELLLIIVVLIVFFGPKRIPDIMQSVGKGIREFKRAMKDVQDEIDKSMNEPPKGNPKTTEPKQIPQPTPNQELKTESSTGSIPKESSPKEIHSEVEQSKTEAKV